MKKIKFIAVVLFAATIFFGCQSVPENIPQDLDARQLIQLGQDNYDLHHYAAAKKYFNTVLDRYGDDPKHYIEAKYELGHLFLKQKNYQTAYNNFTEILEIYENVPVGLPGSYKILCGIELKKIPQDKIAEFEAKAKQQREAEIKAQERAQAEKLARQEEQAKKAREAEIQKAAIEEAQAKSAQESEQAAADEQPEAAPKEESADTSEPAETSDEPQNE